MKKTRHTTFSAFWLCAAIGISTYLLSWQVLQELDDTPKWGTVSLPPAIVQNEEVTATVLYAKTARPMMLSGILSWQTYDKKHEGWIEAPAQRPVIYNSGAYLFRFQPPNDIDMKLVKVTVFLCEIPPDHKTPVYQLIKADHGINSRWTAVSRIKEEASMAAAQTRDISNIYQTALREGYWRFGFNDQSPGRIAITVFYALLSAACGFIVFGRKSTKAISSFSHESSSAIPGVKYDEIRWFWATLFVILVLLGINKQLDFQTLAGDIMRTMAKIQGWYETRKSFQIHIMSMLAGCSAALLTFILYKMRKARPDVIPALMGIIILIGFIVLRGVSLHSIDDVLSTRIAGFRLYGWIEFFGLALIAFSVIEKIRNIAHR